MYILQRLSSITEWIDIKRFRTIKDAKKYAVELLMKGWDCKFRIIRKSSSDDSED